MASSATLGGTGTGTGSGVGTRAPTLVPAYAALALCVALWGFVFVAIAKLLRHLDAVQLVTTRFAIVGLICAGILTLVPAVRPHFTRPEVVRLLVCGLFAVLGAQYTIVYAQNYVSPLLASLIVTFSPAVAAVFAAVFLRTRLGPLEILGFVLALAGVAVVLVVGSGSGAGHHHSSVWGAAIGIVCPICWAGYTMAVAPLVTRHPPIGVSASVSVVGTLVTIPLYPHAVAGLGDLDVGHWGWMLFLASAATVLPNILWVTGLRRLPVHKTSAFMYFVPLWAAVWSAVILGRAPETVAFFGGALVLVGVMLTQGWRGRRAAVVAEAGPAA